MSTKSLLFALSKRRFRWAEGPFEDDARTVARIKVQNSANATSLCTEIIAGTQLSSFEGLGRNSLIEASSPFAESCAKLGESQVCTFRITGCQGEIEGDEEV